MKTLWIVLMAITFSFSSYAKDLSFLRSKSQVVKKYLAQHYPDARYIHQKKISDSVYQVHFVHEDRGFFIDISSSGKVLFKEQELHYDEVPKMIKDQLDVESIYECGVMIETSDGRLFYFVELHEKYFFAEYLFDAAGNMLKRDIM